MKSSVNSVRFKCRIQNTRTKHSLLARPLLLRSKASARLPFEICQKKTNEKMIPAKG